MIRFQTAEHGYLYGQSLATYMASTGLYFLITVEYSSRDSNQVCWNTEPYALL